MTASRQVRRAAERASLKMAQSSYPKGLTSFGLRIQRYEPFKPRGQDWRAWTPLGLREAARRLAKAEVK